MGFTDLPSSSNSKEGITKFMAASTLTSPTFVCVNITAEGFQKAAEASELAFVVAPAIADPMLLAPCSNTWNPAPNDAEAQNNAPIAIILLTIISVSCKFSMRSLIIRREFKKQWGRGIFFKAFFV